MNIQNVTSFLDVVKKYKLLYQSCEYNFLLVKEKTQWIALCITVRLSSLSNPPESKETYFIKDKLRHIKKVEEFDINRFNKTIHKLGKGSMSLSGKHIALADPHSSFFKIYDNPSWNYGGFRDAEGWPAAILLLVGKQISGIIENLDSLTSMIQIHQSNPHDSLPGLCKKHLGFSVYPSDNSRAYIVAPFYKKLENIRYQNATLSGTFKCHKILNPSEFRLTIIYYPSSGEQISSNITFKSPEKETQFKDFKINDRIENIDVKQAALYLVHNGKKIQTYYVQIESTDPSFKAIILHDYGIDVSQETTDMIRENVIDAIDSFNVLSEKHLGCKVFVNNAKTLTGLSWPVKNKEDFAMKMANIASIIDEVHTRDILEQSKTRPEKCGSINLIEHFLQEKNVIYDKDAIKALRKLHHLRSKMRPIHSGEHEIITTLKELDINYPDSNWDLATRKCLKLFLVSIQSLVKNLADIGG